MRSAFRWRIAFRAAAALLPAVLGAACVTTRDPAAPILAPGSTSRAAEEAAEADYRAGLDAIEAGDYEAALAHFSRVVETYPATRVSGLSLYWKGRVEYQLGQDPDAIASLRRYLSLGPTVPFRESAVLLLANSLYGTRAFDQTLEALMDVRQVSPERLDDFLDLARDLVDHLPRPAIETAARREPTRGHLAPFYLQAARWALAAGDSARAAELGRRMLEFPELPPLVLTEARALAGGAAGAEPLTRPRLGVIAPTEARFAQVTEWIRRGVTMALEDVNAERDTPVELVVRMSGGEPDSTAEVIRRFARGERVEAIVGPLVSEIALPAAQVAREEGVPLVSPTATDARLLDIGPGVFTVNALDGSIGHTMGMYAVRNLERTRLAILAVDDAYGRVQADAFAQAVQSAGGHVVIRRDYPRGSTQFTDLLGEVVRAGANAVFLSTKSPNEVLQILNQMAFYELGGILPLGTDAWNDPDFFRQGRGFVRGYYADTFSRDPRVTRWQEFAANYELRYGEPPPNLIPAWGYDATRLALERLSPAAATPNPESYRGASALFRFTPTSVRRAVVLHRVERGEPVALEW